MPRSASPQTPTSTPPDDRPLAASALFSGFQRLDLCQKVIPQSFQQFVFVLYVEGEELEG